MPHVIPKVTVNFKTDQDSETGLYTLEVNITSSDEIQAEILVFRVNKGVNEFCAIATISQLAEFPKFNPEPGEIFFLDNHAIITFEKASDMFSTRKCIELDIQNLLYEFYETDGQVVTEETVIIEPNIVEI